MVDRGLITSRHKIDHGLIGPSPLVTASLKTGRHASGSPCLEVIGVAVFVCCIIIQNVTLIMSALRSRCGLFCPVISFCLFFRHLISAVADWMSTILPHMVWP